MRRFSLEPVAKGSDLDRLIRFATTVATHHPGILRRFLNGLLEGLSSLVQATQARARGFRSTHILVAMIYLMHGKLPIFQPI